MCHVFLNYVIFCDVFCLFSGGKKWSSSCSAGLFAKVHRPGQRYSLRKRMELKNYISNLYADSEPATFSIFPFSTYDINLPRFLFFCSSRGKNVCEVFRFLITSPVFSCFGRGALKIITLPTFSLSWKAIHTHVQNIHRKKIKGQHTLKTHTHRRWKQKRHDAKEIFTCSCCRVGTEKNEKCNILLKKKHKLLLVLVVKWRLRESIKKLFSSNYRAYLPLPRDLFAYIPLPRDIFWGGFLLKGNLKVYESIILLLICWPGLLFSHLLITFRFFSANFSKFLSVMRFWDDTGLRSDLVAISKYANSLHSHIDNFLKIFV